MASPFAMTMSSDGAPYVLPDRITLSSGWMTTEDAAGRSALIGRRPAVAASQPLLFAASFRVGCEQLAGASEPVAEQPVSEEPNLSLRLSAGRANVDFRHGDVVSTGYVLDRHWLDGQANVQQVGDPDQPGHSEQVAVQLEFTSYDLLLQTRRQFDVADAVDLPDVTEMIGESIDSLPVIEKRDILQLPIVSREREQHETVDVGPILARFDDSLTIVASTNVEHRVGIESAQYARAERGNPIGSFTSDVLLEATSRRSLAIEASGSFSIYRFGDLAGSGFVKTFAPLADNNAPEVGSIDCWLEAELPAVELPTIATGDRNGQTEMVLATTSVSHHARRICGLAIDGEPLLIGIPRSATAALSDGCGREMLAVSTQPLDDRSVVLQALGSEHGIALFGSDESAGMRNNFTPDVFDIVSGCFLDESQRSTIYHSVMACDFISEFKPLPPAFDSDASEAKTESEVTSDDDRSGDDGTVYERLLRADRPDRLRSTWVLKSKVPRLNRRKRRGSIGGR